MFICKELVDRLMLNLISYRISSWNWFFLKVNLSRNEERSSIWETMSWQEQKLLIKTLKLQRINITSLLLQSPPYCKFNDRCLHKQIFSWKVIWKKRKICGKTVIWISVTKDRSVVHICMVWFIISCKTSVHSSSLLTAFAHNEHNAHLPSIQFILPSSGSS